MSLLFINQTQIFLSTMIEKDVGSIIGVLVTVIAAIMNVIYNMISALSENNALGISIILMTLIIRAVMLPQGISAQKSQIKMRAVQPEIEKIKKKYGDSSDPEVKRKINMETQAIYQKHKINMFGGCLPLLITLPIFYALIDLMRRLYIYVDKINELYISICNQIYMTPGIAAVGSKLYEICVPKVQAKMYVDIGVANDLVRFIDKFTPSEWDVIKGEITDPSVLRGLNDLLVHRDKVQSFIGINLVNNVSVSWPLVLANVWPGILIPILSGGTSFLMSYVTTKTMPNQDDNAKNSQRIMMFIMPVMMFVFTFGVSGGVGVYWIASNVFAILQQIVIVKLMLNKKDGDKGDIIGKAKEKKA